MEVLVKLSVKQADIATVGGPAVAVNLYAGVKKPAGATQALDKTIGGMIQRTLKAGGFKGDLGEVLVLYPDESGKGVPERVVLLGLGKKESFDTECARRVGGVLAKTLRKLGIEKAATVVHGGDSKPSPRDLARGLAEGILMGAYQYDTYLHGDRAMPLELKEVVVVERLRSRVKGIQGGLRMGENVAYAVNQARELVNGPSNEVTPTHLANTAKKLGKKHGF